MERLRGELLSDVWPRLGEAERRGLASPLGEALAALHRVPVPPIVSQRATWSDFVAGQLRGCCDRQRRLTLSDGWLDQIPGFLEKTPLRASASVLRHTWWRAT